jgi:DNA repair photolyase
VWLSPASDAFTPVAPLALREATLEALSHLLRRGIGVTLTTRGGHPDGDGLLTLARRFPGLLRVEVAAFSADTAARERWEAGAARLGPRMALAGALQRAGAEVVGRIGPILPFANDSEADLRQLVRLFAAQGVRTVAPEWIADGPGLAAQVEREVSRSQARVLEGWMRQEQPARGEPRGLPLSVRRTRLERLVAVAEPLHVHVVTCACSVPGGAEVCLAGPSGLEGRGQLDLFGADAG